MMAVAVAAVAGQARAGASGRAAHPGLGAPGRAAHTGPAERTGRGARTGRAAQTGRAARAATAAPAVSAPAVRRAMGPAVSALAGPAVRRARAGPVASAPVGPAGRRARAGREVLAAWAALLRVRRSWRSIARARLPPIASPLSIRPTAVASARSPGFGRRPRPSTRSWKRNATPRIPRAIVAEGQPTTDDGSKIQFSATAGVDCVQGLCTTFAKECGKTLCVGDDLFQLLEPPAAFRGLHDDVHRKHRLPRLHAADLSVRNVGKHVGNVLHGDWRRLRHEVTARRLGARRPRRALPAGHARRARGRRSTLPARGSGTASLERRSSSSPRPDATAGSTWRAAELTPQCQLLIWMSSGLGAPLPVSTSSFRLSMKVAHLVLQWCMNSTGSFQPVCLKSTMA